MVFFKFVLSFILGFLVIVGFVKEKVVDEVKVVVFYDMGIIYNEIMEVKMVG